MAWTANVQTYISALNDTAPFSGETFSGNIGFPSGNTPISLANGTGAGQIDLAWGDQRSYDTTGVTFDLTSLAAASSNGSQSATFSAIKYLLVRNEGGTNDLTVGNAASVQFTPGFSAATTTVTLQESYGHMAFYNGTAAGWDCTTNKNLKIVAAASTTTGTLILIGED